MVLFDMPSEYKHSWLDVDGVKTHYIEAGEGDPFVLIHGGGAGSSVGGPTTPTSSVPSGRNFTP